MAFPEEHRSPIFVYETRVRFQDCDPAGIVFFSRFFEFFHDAYAAFTASKGLPIADMLKSGAWLAPLTHAEADFRSPIPVDEIVRVEIVRVELRATEMVVSYQVRKGSTEAVAATGQTTHVFVDRKTFKRMKAPAEAVKAFEIFQALSNGTA